MSNTVLETARLILRIWTPADTQPFYEINQDPKVIAFLPGSMTPKEIRDFILLANKQGSERGYTMWAAELKETKQLIGFIGLNFVDWQAHFTPAVEIGWRLGSDYWGHGYATEGARAALEYGFNTIGLDEIVAFTVFQNKRSIRVMEKISLKRDLKGDFKHPKLKPDHRLCDHILYRLTRKAYDKTEH